MSDFDNEKTGGQERPDYYQPNQNEGQTYYTPPQNEQADNNTTYHYSYAGKAQENRESYSNASNYSNGNGNYYQPPQNDNKQNAENGNSPKPPKKKPGAGKIVAIILVICAFVAVVGIVLSTTGVIDDSKIHKITAQPLNLRIQAAMLKQTTVTVFKQRTAAAILPLQVLLKGYGFLRRHHCLQ